MSDDDYVTVARTVRVCRGCGQEDGNHRHGCMVQQEINRQWNAAVRAGSPRVPKRRPWWAFWRHD